LTDGAQHRVALYLLDWDSGLGPRSERVDVLDGSTGAVLDSHTVSSFSGGQYLVWNLAGRLRLQVTNVGPRNAVVSGLFFDPPGGAPPGGSAAFVGTDTTTQGSWQGAYGAQGYNVVGDAVSYPSYAQVSVSGASTYVWAGSTTDVRALQKATNPADRI